MNDMFVQPIIEGLNDVIISNITGCLVYIDVGTVIGEGHRSRDPHTREVIITTIDRGGPAGEPPIVQKILSVSGCKQKLRKIIHKSK